MPKRTSRIDTSYRASRQLGNRPDKELERKESRKMVRLLPMSELDEMMRLGWGDTPRDQIPPNWREINRKEKP